MTRKQIALVTGGNKGLGFEIARQLGQKGYTVVIGARDAAKGTAAAETLRAEGLDVHAVKLDVGDAGDVAKLKDHFKATFGGLDVLVNNAGVALWSQDDLAAFKTTYDANVFGVVAVTYALLPLILESPAGRIVNQSSLLGSLTSIGDMPDAMASFINPAYTSSKAALNGFTVALAFKLRGTKVKVNAAHPGWVKTDLGGDNAPMGVEDGARAAVRLATLGDDGPHGKFFDKDGPLPW